MNPGLLDLEVLVGESRLIDPPAASTVELAALLEEGSWTIESVVAVIRKDTSLSGRLLGLANTGLFGGRHAVCTTEGAVMRLGTGTVLSMAIGRAVRGAMQGPLRTLGLGAGELWRHSVAAALAIDRARAYSRRGFPPQAYASALLHDIGKLLLDRQQPAGGKSAAAGGGTPTRTCHAELGAHLVRSWGFPELIVSGIRFHHAPLLGADQESRRLCTQVALGDAVATALGHTCGTHPRPEFSPALASALEMNGDGFAFLCEDVEERLEDFLEIYS